MNRKPAALDASFLARGSAARKAASHGAKAMDAGAEMTTTVRVDAELHRRLRLLSAHTRRSQRDILRAAVERYLDKIKTGD